MATPRTGREIRLDVTRSQNSPTTQSRYAKTGGNVLERGQKVVEGREYKAKSPIAKTLKKERDRDKVAFKSTGITFDYQGNVKFPNRIVNTPGQKLGAG